MRYISQFNDLVLYRNNGEIAHKFKNGVLVCGDSTTRNGTNLTTDALPYTVDYYAYSSATETEIMQTLESVIATRESEADWVRIEKIGLGYLRKLGYDNTTALASLADGWRGIFFEAPVITPGATTIPAVANIRYEVLSGSVVYDGVTYTVGDIILSDGSTTTTSGTGTFALAIPTALKNTVDQMEAEAFAQAHLLKPTDAIGYWNKINGGYTASSSMTTTDFNFIGANRY